MRPGHAPAAGLFGGLLLLSAIASAEEPGPSGPGASLDAAWEALDAGSASSALKEADAADAPLSCESVLLRGLSHDLRGDGETAEAYLVVYFDLGCRATRHSVALDTYLRLQRARIAALAAPPRPTAPEPEPRRPTAATVHARPDRGEFGLSESAETPWSELELPAPKDGALRLVDARAQTRGVRDSDFVLRVEVLIAGADDEDGVELLYNPPGGSWEEAPMRRRGPNLWGVEVGIRDAGAVYWHISVDPASGDLFRSPERRTTVP